jgi:ferritin
MKNYKFRIQVVKTLEYAQEAEVVIEAATGESAEIQLKEMLDAFEEADEYEQSNPLAEKLADLCDVDIRDFDDDENNFVESKIMMTDILEGPDEI